MSQLPLCRYCKQPYTIARETTEWWEMQCEACKVGHVFSKPSSQAAAKYRANIQRQADRARMVREWERARRTYSFSPTRTPKEIT